MSLTLISTLLQYTQLNIQKFFSTSKLLGNHYDVLNLPRSCTTKEIKESFIKLSKEIHPDINKSKDAHKKFLKINEAYKVLSKAETRHFYDLSLAPPEDNPAYRNAIRVPYRTTFGRDPWKDPSFYMNRNRADDKEYENQPYYGIRGVNRMSNLTIAIICLTLTAIVIGLQALAIRNSVTFRREELIRKSNDAESSLKDLRQTASLNGNELQIELLKRKFSSAAKYNGYIFFAADKYITKISTAHRTVNLLMFYVNSLLETAAWFKISDLIVDETTEALRIK